MPLGLFVKLFEGFSILGFPREEAVRAPAVYTGRSRRARELDILSKDQVPAFFDESAIRNELFALGHDARIGFRRWALLQDSGGTAKHNEAARGAQAARLGSFVAAEQLRLLHAAEQRDGLESGRSVAGLHPVDGGRGGVSHSQVRSGDPPGVASARRPGAGAHSGLLLELCALENRVQAFLDTNPGKRRQWRWRALVAPTGSARQQRAVIARHAGGKPYEN